MKINKIQQILTKIIALAGVGFFTGNVGEINAQVIGDFNRGNCGYGRNGRVISYSRCNVGVAIDADNGNGYLIMKWDNKAKVEVYFNLRTRRAIVNGKKGKVIDSVEGMICFANYENELICTDA